MGNQNRNLQIDSKHEYAGIDLVKLFCAFLVVAIHAEPFAEYIWLDRALGILTRMPVPFFFTAAGYFLLLPAAHHSDSRFESKRLWKYVSRIALLYIIWSVIYIPGYINDSLQFGLATGAWLKRALRAALLTGFSSHLWFLPANMLAAVLVWYGHKFLSPRITLAVAAVLLLIGTGFSTYKTILEAVLPDSFAFLFSAIDFLEARSGLFYGFFYVALGGLVAVAPPQKSRGLLFWLIMFCISLVLLAIESTIGVLVLNVQSTIMWLTAPAAVYSLFMAAMNLQLPISAEFAKKIRNISTAIYTSQFVFISIFQWMGLPGEGILLYLVSLAAIIIFAAGVVYLSRRYKILRYLY